MAAILIQGDGWVFDLERDATTLGRLADNDIVLASVEVSRQHARILRIDGAYYLENLRDTNHTLVNGRFVSGRTRLLDTCQITIGTFTLTFYCQPDRDSMAATSVVDDLCGKDDDRAERICILPEVGLELTKACQVIRRGLDTARIVFHPFGRRSIILEALQAQDPRALQILGRGFHRVIALDVTRGMSAVGRFELGRFYEYAFRTLELAFGQSPAPGFHEQDLMQILMDEAVSLICLLNVHSVNGGMRRRLRSLTQERHQSLIVYRQHSIRRFSPSSLRNIRSSLVEDDFDDEGSKILARPW